MNNWKEIVGYPDYFINKYGTIKSFKRYPLGKLLNPHLDKDGYVKVSLQANGKQKGFRVHRLVAAAFILNPDNHPQVNHKNGIKTDNHVDNLEWSSNINNQQHAWKTGLKVSSLSISDVKKVRELISSGQTNTEISKIFNVDPSTISYIKTGRTWKFV